MPFGTWVCNSLQKTLVVKLKSSTYQPGKAELNADFLVQPTFDRVAKLLVTPVKSNLKFNKVSLALYITEFLQDRKRNTKNQAYMEKH